jgi:hypothetical protein
MLQASNTTNMTTMAPTPAMTNMSNVTTAAPVAANTSAPTATPDATVWSLDVKSEVLSCGQNVQTGMIRGVMGGHGKIVETIIDSDMLAHPIDEVICAQYTSTSQVWAGVNAKGSLLTMDFWVQPQPKNSSSSAVACATMIPSRMQLLSSGYPSDHVVLSASGSSMCVSGPCVNSPLAILTCWEGGNQTWFDQGVGLSVGGIGMILVTFIAVGLAGRYTVSM